MKTYSLEVTVWELDDQKNINIAYHSGEELITSHDFSDLEKVATLYNRVMTFIEKEKS